MLMFEWLPEARCCVARCVQCVWLSIWHVSNEQQQQEREKEAREYDMQVKRFSLFDTPTQRRQMSVCKFGTDNRFRHLQQIHSEKHASVAWLHWTVSAKNRFVCVSFFFHTSNAAYQGTPTIYYSVWTSRLNSNLLGFFMMLKSWVRIAHSNTNNKNKTIDKCIRLTLTIRLDTVMNDQKGAIR